MGTTETIDHIAAARRAWDPRASGFASDLDLPTWEEFTDARERFFENLAAAPLPPRARGAGASERAPATR